MRLNDFTLRGTELVVNGQLKIETENLSGNTSATDRANNGIKPKSLTVSLVIKFDNADDLSALVRLAEAVDANGKLRVYNIVDPTARAMNIRQVQFTDAFNARDMVDKKAWRVNFTLAEYLSVPEKTEQRAQAQEAETQSAEGQPVADVSEPAVDGESQQLTGFEKVLKWADDGLAPKQEAETSATA